MLLLPLVKNNYKHCDQNKRDASDCLYSQMLVKEYDSKNYCCEGLESAEY